MNDKNDEDEESSCKLTEDRSSFSDLDTDWAWVVLVASFCSLMLIGGTMYAVGIIHIALLERYREDVSKTAWAGALQSALMSVGGPISTALIDRFSCRVALMTSGCLYAIGYLATAFAPSIEVSIFTCGIIAGCGGAAGYTTSLCVVGFNFRSKLNLAMGFAASGVGAGMLVMAPVFEATRDYYGNSGFFIALAGLTLHITVFGVLCFPSKLELHMKKQRKLEIQRRTQSGHSNLYSVFCMYLHVAIQRPVLCLCFCMFNYGLGTFLVILHLPNYVVQKGSTHIQGSLLISLSGISGLVGRILTGIAANHERVNDIFLYAGSMGVVSLATFLFPLYSNSFTGQMFYGAIFGMFFGCCYVLSGSVNIKFVGVKSMAAALGLEFFFCGLGAIVGPVLAGWLVDNGGTYEQSFIVAAFFILVATILGMATVFFSKRQNNEQDKEIEIQPTNSGKTICDNNKQESLLTEMNESRDQVKQTAIESNETEMSDYDTKDIAQTNNMETNPTRTNHSETELNGFSERNTLLDEENESYKHIKSRNS